MGVVAVSTDGDVFSVLPENVAIGRAEEQRSANNINIRQMQQTLKIIPILPIKLKFNPGRDQLQYAFSSLKLYLP